MRADSSQNASVSTAANTTGNQEAVPGELKGRIDHGRSEFPHRYNIPPLRPEELTGERRKAKDHCCGTSCEERIQERREHQGHGTGQRASGNQANHKEPNVRDGKACATQCPASGNAEGKAIDRASHGNAKHQTRRDIAGVPRPLTVRQNPAGSDARCRWPSHRRIC